MKKYLLIFILIFLMLASNALALGRYQRIITDIYGNVVAGASAYVYAVGTTNLSSIYSDAAGSTPLANPVTSNANGRIQFYVADGTYDVTVSGTGIIAWTDSGVQIFDVVSKFTSNILGPAYGGSGVSNNALSTETRSGNFPLTWTLTASTSLTLPTTGTLSTLAGAETFTNKTLTTPIIMSVLDTNSRTLFAGSATSNAVDYLTIANAAAASPVINLSATGSDTNISLNFVPKGSTGYIGFGVATPAYFVDSAGDINIATGKVYRINGTQIALANLSDTFSGTGNGLKQTSPTITTPIIASIKDVNGNVWFESSPTATAVNYLTATNGIAGNPANVILGAAGASTNINIELLPKGTGKVGILNSSPSYTLDVTGDVNVSGTYRINGVGVALSGTSQISVLQDTSGYTWLASGSGGASGQYIQIFNSAPPQIITAGTGSSIGLYIDTKGGGTIQFASTTTSALTSGAHQAVSIVPYYSNSSGTTANTDLLINRNETNIGSGAQYLTEWQVGGSYVYAMTNKGHHLVDDAGSGIAVPSISTCGTGTPTLSANSNDHVGYIDIDTGSPTACTITFGTAYTNAPVCQCTAFNATSVSCVVSASSNSAQTFTLSATAGGIGYSCVGLGGVK